ncbi:hypothetical protein V1478_001367 [Vespula squamosa]|uniref:Maturase K n=1 Tax=Vespula squamosa TaxID=30214 RepID=A0ABD2C187_VESSQ
MLGIVSFLSTRFSRMGLSKESKYFRVNVNGSSMLFMNHRMDEFSSHGNRDCQRLYCYNVYFTADYVNKRHIHEELIDIIFYTSNTSFLLAKYTFNIPSIDRINLDLYNVRFIRHSDILFYFTFVYLSVNSSYCVTKRRRGRDGTNRQCDLIITRFLLLIYLVLLLYQKFLLIVKDFVPCSIEFRSMNDTPRGSMLRTRRLTLETLFPLDHLMPLDKGLQNCLDLFCASTLHVLSLIDDIYQQLKLLISKN